MNRVAHAGDNLLPLAIRMPLFKRLVQESQSLQGLSQIVTRGSQKNRFGAICSFCEFLCSRNLAFELLSLGNVGRQAPDAHWQSARVELGGSNLLQPHLAIAIRSLVAECHRIRG